MDQKVLNALNRVKNSSLALSDFGPDLLTVVEAAMEGGGEVGVEAVLEYFKPTMFMREYNFDEDDMLKITKFMACNDTGLLVIDDFQKFYNDLVGGKTAADFDGLTPIKTFTALLPTFNIACYDLPEESQKTFILPYSQHITQGDIFYIGGSEIRVMKSPHGTEGKQVSDISAEKQGLELYNIIDDTNPESFYSDGNVCLCMVPYEYSDDTTMYARYKFVYGVMHKVEG